MTPMIPAMPPLMIFGKRANWGTAEILVGWVEVVAAIFLTFGRRKEMSIPVIVLSG